MTETPASRPSGQRWPAGRWLLTGLLYAPLLVQAWRYQTGSFYYGEILHWSGEWATWLLLFTLAVTPLRRVFGSRSWTNWLLRRRRDFGVAMFVYSLAHLLVYLQRESGLRAILSEALWWGMTTGWIALLLLLPLALTSNDSSMRALRSRWKQLHRLVYPAAILVMVHWYGTAFSPVAAYWHAALLLLLFLLRWPRSKPA